MKFWRARRETRGKLSQLSLKLCFCCCWLLLQKLTGWLPSIECHSGTGHRLIHPLQMRIKIVHCKSQGGGHDCKEESQWRATEKLFMRHGQWSKAHQNPRGRGRPKMNMTDHQWDEISGSHISDLKGGYNFHVTYQYESENYTGSQRKSVRSRVRETIKVIFLRDGLN